MKNFAADPLEITSSRQKTENAASNVWGTKGKS